MRKVNYQNNFWFIKVDVPSTLVTKLIDKIKTCLKNNDYLKLGDNDNCLERIITKVPRVTTQLIDLVSKDLKKSDEILEFFTEQELRVLEIRKNILPQCSEKRSKTYQGNI